MNQSVDRGAKRRSAPPILQNSFRPFFLGGAIWAALLVPLWVADYFGLTGLGHAMSDHAHEMLYGFLAAIVCGFALTAIPNWTGRSPVSGTGLAALFSLWLAGRLAYLMSDQSWAMLLDMLFLVAFAAVVLREILAGKNWRNLPVAAMILLFAGSHLAFHQVDLNPAAIRATFGVAILLIALIGGRIVPSFTRNWLASRNDPATARIASPMQGMDKFALGLTALALLAWIALPFHPVSGGLLIFAGLSQFYRMLRWQGLTTLSEPLVWSLHAGYFWLVVGLCLTGGAIVWPAHIPAATGLHAIAAGLVGSMTLAVMTRASLGHTGRPRTASVLTTSIYVLVHIGAVLRIVAAFTGNDPLWLATSAIVWSSAFGLFAIGYAPMLSGSKR